jgi:DNA-binding NarL/FixJ family response regulator
VDSAIKMSASFKPDIIFYDIEMPGKNGIELIKQIRDGGSEWDPRIPIITFTSFTEQNRVHALRDAGSSHYLSSKCLLKNGTHHR